MTRALFSLMHFRIAEATAYHPLVWIAAPLLGWLYCRTLYRMLKKR